VETMYLTRMSNPGKPGEVIEQKHTRSDIISRAQTVLATHMSLEGGLPLFAGLEEVGKRGVAGENTVYGYVDKSGKPVDFTKDMELEAAIAVLNSKGNHFEATPIK
jgi:hypothetical protein